MEKKEVTIGNPVSVAGVTLIPIVESSIKYGRSQRRIVASGTVQPVSIIVVTPSGRSAFRITGEEVPLDQLGKEVPAIRKLLAKT